MSNSFLRRIPNWLYALLLFAVCVLIALASRVVGWAQDPLTAALLTLTVFALVGPLSILYWRRLDEAAREAHKFAWYWGGSAGIVVVLAAFMALTAPGGPQIAADFLGADEPKDLFAHGMVATLLAQVTGYLVAWAGWWIARR